MSRVRTVLGDVPAGDPGLCDAHDHLFLRTPALRPRLAATLGEEVLDAMLVANPARAFALAEG
ncbi:hypothetical protein [Streptomyces sp. NPDC086010]|uniref:hypothetical protein n=1 Tax=Streptomyces sp. NPDC086010 TaxID=3365745 RepID=UPI0037D765BA